MEELGRKKKFFLKEKNFSSPNSFFQQILCHLGPRWKREGKRCHGCIQNEFPKWVGTHEIIQLNDMSTIWQKHGF